MATENPDADTTQGIEADEKASPELKRADVLSFRCVNRILSDGEIEAEFALMRAMFTKAPTPADFYRVGMGSGSHLLKLTTPRADINQCVLRFARPGSNALPFLAPSLNAPDIPYAKIVYRPLEILGRVPKSVLDHIREPDDISERILSAFIAVFGGECLDAFRSALLGDGQQITKLPETGEFPIIFLPRSGGGDLQATPVSPVETFMGFKNMSAAWFLKQEKDAPPVPRGRWTKQSISAKPQNISGMIGGPRQRFFAQMPPVMRGYEASLWRYARGGSFPAWRHDDVEAAVLHYAGRLDMEYTNSDIRAGTDWYADRLIRDALDFIAEVQKDAREFLEKEGKDDTSLRDPPRPSALLFRRRWKRDDRERAMKALSSPHFIDRERVALEHMEA
ncbi:hypothetical protein [Paracoccus jeotgali]|uniref:hypothetical protein n=1 Tax=Paracoccus jeotgali TaxID=2065379 RepID=UPI0028A6BC89|nr:hypothetical protein [Paracoccus jeotgali]